MRRNLLGVAAVSISVLAVGLLAITTSAEKQYVPRSSEESMEAAGAVQYLHSLRANQVTGKISQTDVKSAELQLNQMSVQNKSATLGLNFQNKGPDNGGGRTRAFLIDNQTANNSLLYAASVAGGVYKSSNAGLSWVSISNGLTNMATVSLTQASNGDLFVGTGETMFATVGPGTGTASSPGMIGGGIFKSADGGDNWTLLSNTEPPANTNNSDWAAVGTMGADPIDATRIYAGTRGGLRRSDDGGTTWSNPLSATGWCTDLAVGPDGSVWANVGGHAFYSPSGDDNSWVQISKNLPGNGDLGFSSGRQKFAISAQDPNTVYVVQLNGSALKGVYRTYDRGATWDLIQEKTPLFDPMCNTSSGQCQGNWDLLLGVSPHDKDQIFLGGITIWEWNKTTGWRQVDSQGIPVFDVHSDKHTITWDPMSSNIIYVTTDGGVHKSSDGGYTWQDMNKNYNTTQFYNINVGYDRTLIGGTQDNGTWYIDGDGNTPNSGYTLGGVDGFRGDGGFSTISWLDNEQMFTEYQYGRMGRSANSGVSFSTFWDNRITSGMYSGIWMLPYYLYETTSDPLSEDSVLFNAYPSVKSEGFGNGDTVFVNTLTKQQAAGQYVPSSFKVESGGLVITSDAQGVLSGDGYGTFDAATGDYDVTFTTVPLAEVIASCEVTYPAGSIIAMGSNINELPFNHTLSQALSPFDSVEVQDPVQSVFVAGLTNSVWMTRMSHNWSEPTEWWKIASMSGTSQSVTMSADGNHAWIGTENGQLVRVSNINNARSLATADIDQGTNVQITSDMVKSFGGRNITSIAVHPGDPDKVAVTLGNYGNSSYVYYSSNATSANPVFDIKQGNLPAFPVYSVTFDKGSANSLIIGTEYGIFTTDNINASSPPWTEENNGIPRIPVFTLVQYRTSSNSTDANMPIYEGDVFVGTHGRGMYVTEDLMTARPVDIEEEAPLTFSKSKEQLTMYPNPAIDFTTVDIRLNKTSDVAIIVRDINGRVVKQIKMNKMSSGKQQLSVNTSDLSAGTYLLTLQAGDDISSGKFVVTK